VSKKPIKRWNSATVSPLWTKNLRSGSADLGLHDDHAAALFAALVTEFTYLEKAMDRVFSRLVGTDDQTASQLCQKIMSASARVQVMRALLHHSKRNADKGDVYDELIDEFEAVSFLRNQYVHGLWETADDGELYLVRPRDDPYALGALVAKRFDIEEMAGARARILGLWSRVHRELFIEEERSATEKVDPGSSPG
jgi:hypothetical protein